MNKQQKEKRIRYEPAAIYNAHYMIYDAQYVLLIFRIVLFFHRQNIVDVKGAPDSL